nr:serine/threonine-protein kinase [Micromonospora sp. DSM 115978]
MIVDLGAVQSALPGYVVGGLVGRGAFGMVLAARHRRLDRQVAVKVLLASAADFETEARMLARLDHPHVVRIYDCVEHDGLGLIIMEMLDGGSLRTRSAAGITAGESCAVVVAAAEALEAAHQAGMLHRDVKPENLLFSGSGQVKVTDFGIAKIFEGSAANASRPIGTA